VLWTVLIKNLSIQYVKTQLPSANFANYGLFRFFASITDVAVLMFRAIPVVFL